MFTGDRFRLNSGFTKMWCTPENLTRRILSWDTESVFHKYGTRRYQLIYFWVQFLQKDLCYSPSFLFLYLFLDKSHNLSKIVSVLLSASVERFFVSLMQDFFFVIYIKTEGEGLGQLLSLLWFLNRGPTKY